jgi:nucleotide-binding universal stress UspA family protein
MKCFRNIVYVTEWSVDQGAAIERAVALARNNQADLTVIDVIPESLLGIAGIPGLAVKEDPVAGLMADHREKLESLLAPHSEGPDVNIRLVVGKRFIEVIRAVLSDGFDLVLKPAQDPEWLDRLFGSDDMHLLRKCPCPVWLTRPGEKANYQNIVAAVDFDPDREDEDAQALNTEIVDLASSLAVSDFASLHLLHVWDAPEAGLVRVWADNPNAAEVQITEYKRTRHQRALEALKRDLRARLGKEQYEYLGPQTHLKKGVPGKVIPAMVAEMKADLVVMGTLARSGVPGLFIGNTAETVLEQLHCSVLAIKPPGFVSPVTVSKD